MFESNLLSQINIQSPLPTFIETEIVKSINESLRKTFQFCHLLLSERFTTVAEKTFPYNDELYLIFQLCIERLLLFNANTTFTEFMFGLQRCTLLDEPPGNNHHNNNVGSTLRALLCGPPPALSSEEAAMRYGSPSFLSLGAPSTTTTPTTAAAPSSSSLGRPQYNNNNEQLHPRSSSELYATSTGAPYAYLRFNDHAASIKWVSLFLVCVKPYLERKLRHKYEEATDQSEDSVLHRQSLQARLFPAGQPVSVLAVFFSLRHWSYLLQYRVLPLLYPLYHVTQASATLLYSVLYLCELTPYLSLPHRLARLLVRRSQQSDLLYFHSKPHTRRALLLARVLLVSLFCGFRLLELVRPTHRDNEDNERPTRPRYADADLPIPPPPVFGVDVPLSAAPSTAAEASTTEGPPPLQPVPEDGVCPLCHQPATNVSVLQSSGIIGCYPCLTAHVRRWRQCPVTGSPTDTAQIRRLYES